MVDPGEVTSLRTRWPFASPTIAIAFGALLTVPVGTGQVVLSWVDIANIVVLVAGFVAIRRTGSPARPADPAVWVYAGLLVLFAVQSAVPFVGESLDLEIASGASRFVGPAAVLLGLTWLRASGVERTDWGWREAFTVLGVVVAAGILFDVMASLGDDSVGGFYDWKRTIEQPLGVSNIVAAYTALTFWPAATLVVEDRRWIPAAGVILLATGLTLSRGAALGLVVAAAVLVVGRWNARATAVGLLVVTLGVTILPIVLDTEAGADGLLSSAMRVRDEQSTAAFEAWQDHPVLGVGLNRFQEDVQVRTSQPSAAAVDGVIPYDHPNNAWMVALAETGLVGAGLYLTLWVLLAMRVIRMPSGLEQVAAAGALAGLAVHAQLEALTFTRGIETVLALLLAATWTSSAAAPTVVGGAPE